MVEPIGSRPPRNERGIPRHSPGAPFRLRALTACALLGLTTLETGASAEEARCGLGLVLGVPEATANDIVSAVCTAARTRRIAGSVRVGIVQTSSLAVTVSRVDPSGREEAMRLDARDANDAITRAPNLLAAFGEPIDATPKPADKPPALAKPKAEEAPTPKPSAPPSTPATAPAPAPKPNPYDAPIDPPTLEPLPPETSEARRETPANADKAPEAPSLITPRSLPGFVLGAHGGISVGKVAKGPAMGGGAAFGIGDEHVQGLVDFTIARSEDGRTETFQHILLTAGARMLVGSSILRPAFGGGWSISHFEAGKAGTSGQSEGGGLGLYGEIGAFVVPERHHEIGGLVRMNLPLYEGEETTKTSYGTFQSSRGDLAPPTFTFLLAYVHPFK